MTELLEGSTSIDFWRMRARPDLRWNTENSWIRSVYLMEKNVKFLCKCGEKVMCKQERWFWRVVGDSKAVKRWCFGFS